MTTKNARNIHEIKSRTAITKAAFNKKKTLRQQIRFTFKEETRFGI
jgi:hypothetical protein